MGFQWSLSGVEASVGTPKPFRRIAYCGLEHTFEREAELPFLFLGESQTCFLPKTNLFLNQNGK